jgi:deoxyribonuclease V
MTIDLEDLRRVQARLRERVRLTPLQSPPELVAAVDVHFVSRDLGLAAVVLCRIADGEIVARHHVTGSVTVPYIPGFLSFREMPLCRSALEALDHTPDVVLVDGQGIAHPRRFGLACHLGVEVDLPTVGVAKSRLFGRADEPGPRKGDRAPILDGMEEIGSVVRTRDRTRPLFVSPGHRVTIGESVDLVLALCTRYRLPDPSRAAHRFAQLEAKNLRNHAVNCT